MSHRKAKVAIVLICVVGLLISLPQLLESSQVLVVSCNGPNYRISSKLSKTEKVLATLTTLLVLLSFIFVFQLRILMIALTTKLRLIRMRVGLLNRVRADGGINTERLQVAGRMARMVWGNLLASMIVVFVTGLTNLPIAVLDILGNMGSVSRTTLMILNYGSAIQHFYAFFVYLIFFRNSEPLPWHMSKIVYSGDY